MTKTLYRLAFLLVTTFAWHHTTSAQDTVQLDFVCSDGEFGQTVCVDVIVENFDDIASLDFTINWDPAVLDFIDIQNAAMSGSSWYNLVGPDALRIVWIGFPDVLTIPDGGLLFQLCFQVTALGTTSSPVGLNPDLLIEVSNGPGETLPVNSTPCTVNVMPPSSVSAVLTSCGALGMVRPCGDLGQDGDGSFTITVAGGTAPYAYTWVNTSNGAINGAGVVAMDGGMDSQSVPPGTYDIVVTDALGNMVMYTVTVDEQAPSFCTQGFNPTCFNFTNGRIVVEATDGSAPYSVLWENVTNPAYSGSAFILGSSTQINSLPLGEYHLTITDDKGCGTIDTVLLGADPFLIAAFTTNATCLGSEDGAVSLSFAGANPFPGGVYEVEASWLSGTFMLSQLNTPPSLDPGDYSVTVSDQVNNCDTVFTFTIGSDTDITADFVISPPTCPGFADASVTITAFTNGINNQSYDYQLVDSSGNAVGAPVTGVMVAIISDLEAGSYGVVIQEGVCRSDTINFTIDEPMPVTIDVVEIVPNGCVAGQTAGEITVQASGGSIGGGSDYVYSWNGGTIMGSNITDLPSGNYFLTVTDDNLCSATATINVPQATGPTIDDILISELSCDGDSLVTVEVVFTEGSTPVSVISWSNGGTTAVIQAVAPDTLMVTIRDSLFCFDIATAILPSVPTIVIDSVVVVDPTCGGDSDGTITVHPSGGVEPYTYIWSTQDTSTNNLLAGLSAGQYGVTIIDADSCSIVDTMVTLVDPIPLTFIFSGIGGTTCSDSCNGAATLMPQGGMNGVPYDIIWENGQRDTAFQSSVTGLCGGFVSAIISQDNLCFYEDSVMIPSPAVLDVDTIGLSNITCFGANDGFVSLLANGGTGMKTITWNTLPPGAIQNQLAAGTYYYTVNDENGCMLSDSITIVEPDTLIAFIDSAGVSPVSCNNPNSGVIAVDAMGGSPSYDYTWSPQVSTSEMATGLSSGQYFITVTDLAGCTDSVSIVLPGADPVIGFLSDISNPPCFGESTLISVDTAMGGVGGFTFSINGGQQFPLDTSIAVTAGLYNVIVQDSMGCSDTTVVFVENPDPIELTVMPESPIVNLGDSLLIEILTQGLQGQVDSVFWTSEGPGILSCNDCLNPFVSNVIPTIYTVTVRDSAGCVASLDFLVEVNNNRQVFIPNVFTPNFDGRNDDFVLHLGQGVVGVPSMRVFDRWGELMVEQLGISTTGLVTIPVWNGEFGGQMMLPGVYVYMIEVAFADGQTLIFRGDVTLLR